MNNTKIVAIAKDEGAYLPEWIFHHLYFGFKAIDIFINRTTDNSIEILDKISIQHPSVNYYEADWIDTIDDTVSPKLQKIVYAMALNDKKNKEAFSHILFIDIDEFWTPSDFATSIGKFIETLPKNHVSCSFPWFNMAGDTNTFQELADEIKGTPHALVKSLCSTKQKVNKIRLHLPVYPTSHLSNCLLPDGSTFQTSKKFPQQMSAPLRNKQYAFNVVHRMHRSECEYISLLHRGNPESNGSIKLNRKGWKSTTNEFQDTCNKTLNINAKNKAIYNLKRAAFLKALDINTELEQSRSFVINRYKEVLKLLPSTLRSQKNRVIRSLNGLSDKAILDILESQPEKS